MAELNKITLHQIWCDQIWPIVMYCDLVRPVQVHMTAQIKEMEMAELKKIRREVTRRMAEYQKLYDLVKNQRNKFVNLIQVLCCAVCCAVCLAVLCVCFAVLCALLCYAVLHSAPLHSTLLCCVV